MEQKFHVKHAAKLLEYLFEVLPEIKKTRVREYLKNRCISVNGQSTTQFDQPLLPGDEVRIDDKSLRAVTPSSRFALDIVHEDDSIVLINKPAGLLTVGTDTIQRETAIFALNDYLNKKAQGRRKGTAGYQKRIFVVHRLDRDVSGLLLFAKNEAAKFWLQDHWDEFSKEYAARVEGCPQNTAGKITSYLTENKRLHVFSGPRTPESKKAVTHYKVIKKFHGAALLWVVLETGRKHQIRVHLSDIGCPIVGDKTYGAKTNPFRHICLHAAKLTFTHPVSKKSMTFFSEPPRFFEA